MRQVLFRIPLDGVLQLGGIALPWFGFGILLVAWVAFGLASFFSRRRATGGKFTPDDMHAAIVWTVIAGLIVAAPTIQRRFGFDGIPIFGYGFMLFIGFVTAVSLASRRIQKEGLSPEIIWDLAPWVLIPGILGLRSFFAVQYPHVIFANCQNASDYLAAFVNLSQGGLVLYGGMMGSTVGFAVFCRRRKLHFLGLCDVITPSIFVGIGFGRLGCLMNGCCFGDVCNLPWAIRFPNGAVPFQALVMHGIIAPDAPYTPWLHPTQIYSAIDGFLIAWVTSMFYPYRRRNGEVFGVGLMIYATTRFLIEFLRGDEPGQLGTGMTISQLISLATFLTGLLLILDRARRPAFRQIAVGA